MDIQLILKVAIVMVTAYFLGCFNGAVIVSKYILRNDVRNHGSGNAGLTNFYRVFGGPLTLAVILTDVIKAVIALWAAGLFFVQADSHTYMLVRFCAGLWCMIGHMYPCMFHFKGGKGVLSGGTVAIMIDWRLALLVWGAFILLAIATRYVSLGSIAAGALFPVGTWFFVDQSISIMVVSTVLGGLLVWKHNANLVRLIKGEESKFSLRKKKTEA